MGHGCIVEQEREGIPHRVWAPAKLLSAFRESRLGIVEPSSKSLRTETPIPYPPPEHKDGDDLVINGIRFIRAEGEEEFGEEDGMEDMVGGGGNQTPPPSQRPPLTSPPQLTPQTPASRLNRPEDPGYASRSLFPESDSDSDTAGPSARQRKPSQPASSNLQPGETGHLLTRDLGNEGLRAFLAANQYILKDRVIYRGKTFGVASFQVMSDHVSPQEICDMILKARDMLQVTNKPFVRFDIQATLVLKKIENGKEVRRLFLASSNTSLIEGRAMTLFPGANLNFLRQYFESISVHERVLMLASLESKESLECIAGIHVIFYYSP